MNHTRDTASPHRTSGRRAFVLGSLAAGAAGLTPSVALASQSDGSAQAAARLVSAFCAAVSKLDAEAMRPFLADDIVYRMTETAAPIVGAEGVLDAYRKLNATSITFEVVEAFTAGPLVINRRVDRFVSPRSFTWRGVGVFFVKEGKIKEWSDYTISMERS